MLNLKINVSYFELITPGSCLLGVKKISSKYRHSLRLCTNISAVQHIRRRNALVLICGCLSAWSCHHHHVITYTHCYHKWSITDIECRGITFV